MQEPTNSITNPSEIIFVTSRIREYIEGVMINNDDASVFWNTRPIQVKTAVIAKFINVALNRDIEIANYGHVIDHHDDLAEDIAIEIAESWLNVDTINYMIDEVLVIVMDVLQSNNFIITSLADYYVDIFRFDLCKIVRKDSIRTQSYNPFY